MPAAAQHSKVNFSAGPGKLRFDFAATLGKAALFAEGDSD